MELREGDSCGLCGEIYQAPHFSGWKMAQTQDWYHRKHGECETALVDALTTISTAPISLFRRQKIRILNFEKSNVSENKAQLG